MDGVFSGWTEMLRMYLEERREERNTPGINGAYFSASWLGGLFSLSLSLLSIFRSSSAW